MKEMRAYNKNLLRNANLLLRNMILLTLEYRGKDKKGKNEGLELKALATIIGLGEKALEKFLAELCKEGWVVYDKKKYKRVKKEIKP